LIRFSLKNKRISKNKINHIVKFTFVDVGVCVAGCGGTTFSIDGRADVNNSSSFSI
jgi:hypothetical protein